MRKTIKIMLIISLALLSLTACTKKEKPPIPHKEVSDNVKFMQEYESLNGEKNSSGQEYRTLYINKENPFVYTSAEEVVKMIDNEETFYVYFGSKYCPWCRSVIEQAIAVANQEGIEKIYYVDIWGEDHEEILRDVYELNEKGKAEEKSKGTDAYYDLLERLDKVLSAYTLTNSKGKKVSVGEKRITAPNFIYIEKGKAVELISGISKKQSTSRDILTDEMLKDEQVAFKAFFSR